MTEISFYGEDAEAQAEAFQKANNFPIFSKKNVGTNTILVECEPVCAVKPCRKKAIYRAFLEREEVWVCEEDVEYYKNKGYRIEKIKETNRAFQ